MKHIIQKLMRWLKLKPDHDDDHSASAELRCITYITNHVQQKENSYEQF